MFKKVVCFIMSVCLFLVCVGCSGNSSLSYTFSVETGDSVKVTLDTSDGYMMISDLPFVISCEGETLSQGTFILGDAYEDYVSIVESDEEAVLLDSSSRDGMEYIFWSYNDQEFNFAILLEGGRTGIVLGNNVSEDSAKECFERLSFTVVE